MAGFKELIPGGFRRSNAVGGMSDSASHSNVTTSYQNMDMPPNKIGMLEKARAGIFPGCAPLGYKNVRLTLQESWVEVDTETAPLVKEAFQLVAEGRLSSRAVLLELTQRGLRSRNGRIIEQPPFMRMLKNPFYVGEMRFDGQTFQGHHPPLVSRKLFETVQRRLA